MYIYVHVMVAGRQHHWLHHGDRAVPTQAAHSDGSGPRVLLGGWWSAAAHLRLLPARLATPAVHRVTPQHPGSGSHLVKQIELNIRSATSQDYIVLVFVVGV